MIVVTGATGKLGSLIVEKLQLLLRASEIAVSVRDPGKAAHLQAKGIRVRQGNFGKPDTLKHAFEGVSQVLSCLQMLASSAATLSRNTVQLSKLQLRPVQHGFSTQVTSQQTLDLHLRQCGRMQLQRSFWKRAVQLGPHFEMITTRSRFFSSLVQIGRMVRSLHLRTARSPGSQTMT